MNIMPHPNARVPFLKQHFMKAIKKNDVEEVRRLLNDGLDVDTTFNSGYDMKSALCICIEEGRMEVANFLIKNDCSVNLGTGFGLTPLHLSVLSGNYEFTILLLKNRANVNARDGVLQTPLHIVCSTGCFETYLALVDAGADVNALDIDHRTPLLYACLNGNTMIALSLLEKGADVGQIDQQNNTALVYALSFEPSLTLVESLIRKGAEVNAVGCASVPILSFLLSLSRNYVWNISEACDILKLLIKSGCKLNVSMCSGHNPLHIAVAYGKTAIVKILLNAGCFSKVDRLGRTPLFYACRCDFNEIARVLIANGITWNQETWLQNPTLRAACNEHLVALCVEESRRFPKLLELTRTVIRRVLAPDIEECVDCLPYPPVLKEYIKLDHC